MKKLLTLLLTMSLMLVFTACGNKEKETDSDKTNTQTKVETSDKKEEDDKVETSDAVEKETDEKVEETTSEHKHSYASAVTKAATCTTDGTKTFTCSCGDSYTEKIAATGSHTWGEWETIKEPTGTTNGTSQRKCNTCSATENKDIDKISQYFHNTTLDGRWIASTISVVPKEVYFENGKLVAHCYVVNGYSTKATMVNISEISVRGTGDKAIAHAYFGNQNFTIPALSYIEHTFTFGADTIISSSVDMSTLGFNVSFSANH